MSMIVQHIAYLLRSHDCVVVLGIGAFIAQRVNAHIDADNGLMYPPSRMLGFNSEIGHDDGLLASSVARQLNVSYDQALKTVATEADALRCQLINTGEIALPRIGYLRRDQEGRITFEPFENNVVSSPYLGLIPIKIAPVKAAYTEKETHTGLAANIRPRVHRRIKAAASVALLICMGALLTTPVDLNQAQLASLGISVSEPDNDNITEEEEIFDFEIRKASPSARLSIAMPTEKSVPVISTHINATPATTAEKEDNYYLIVASLPTKQLAEKFIATEGNPSLGILQKDGRYRVYAATGSTQAETLEQLHTGDLSSRYPDAWVCAK